MPAYVQNKAEAQFVCVAMVALVDNDVQYSICTYVHTLFLLRRK